MNELSIYKIFKSTTFNELIVSFTVHWKVGDKSVAMRMHVASVQNFSTIKILGYMLGI